jgi:hypothetical protein
VLALAVTIMSIFIVVKTWKKSSSSSSKPSTKLVQIERYQDDDTVVPKCDKGYILQTQNNQCTCKKLPTPSCPTGYTFDKNYGCKADTKCPPNFSMQTDAKGQSVCKADPIEVPPVCPADGELGVNNSYCRTAEICPAGFSSVPLNPGCCLPEGVTDASQCPQ